MSEIPNEDKISKKASTQTYRSVTRIDCARSIIKVLESNGVKLRDDSRFLQLEQVLCKRLIEYDDPDFPIALESIKDLHQVWFALETLSSYWEEPKFRANLAHLANDSAVPQLDQQASNGRDAQFELYLAAICHRAKMTPISLDEPDLICQINGERFGIAAKRIKSKNKIQARIEYAMHQVAKSGLPGVVALDVSLAFNRSNVPIISKLQSRLYELKVMTSIRSSLEPILTRPIVKQLAIQSNTFGVVVFDSAFCLGEMDQWEHIGVSYHTPTVIEHMHFVGQTDTFFEAFVRGLQ